MHAGLKAKNPKGTFHVSLGRKTPIIDLWPPYPQDVGVAMLIPATPEDTVFPDTSACRGLCLRQKGAGQC
jgi:hypothetical protein